MGEAARMLDCWPIAFMPLKVDRRCTLALHRGAAMQVDGAQGARVEVKEAMIGMNEGAGIAVRWPIAHLSMLVAHAANEAPSPPSASQTFC
jgi:hypothetical protein